MELDGGRDVARGKELEGGSWKDGGTCIEGE